MAHAEKKPAPTEVMAQCPLIYIKPGFLPACPSENILLFWTMHRSDSALATTVLVGRFIFFFPPLSAETIKPICEEIFKVDRKKTLAKQHVSGVWIAGDRGLFPWRYRERKTHFSVFVKSKVLTKHSEIFFPGVKVSRWLSAVCGFQVSWTGQLLHHTPGNILLLKWTQRDPHLTKRSQFMKENYTFWSKAVVFSQEILC